MTGATRRQVGSLPAEVSSFVGRGHESSEVRRLLSQTRLLTLTGPGGVGKTRLALHVAHQVSKTYPDGVWLVDLASLREPRLLAHTVVESLRIRDESGREPRAVLRTHLADASLMLLLDNCEHLLDACASLVGSLLRVAPDLRVLATSREPLKVPGEYVYDVPPLSVPKGSFTEKDLQRYEAAALLYDRATATVPFFTADAEGAVALIRVAQRLDGLPLALELAAARLRALSPQQLLKRLDDLFAALGAPMRTRRPRQRTLRSMIDWSFDLCSPAEQTLWARISVFSGSFDLEAVDAVCLIDDFHGDTTLDLVTGLINKSILLREGQDGEVRYHLLETIRQYGRERLDESGEAEVFQRRHRDHYVRLASRMEREWYSRRQLAWFTRMRAEHPNIRVALDHCVTRPGEATAGLRIASALRAYWHSSGCLDEGRRWLGRLLRLESEPGETRAKAALNHAWLALFLNDVAAAKRELEATRALVDRFGDPLDQAVSALVEGIAALLSQDMATDLPPHRRSRAVARVHTAGAATMLETALARHRAVGDAGGELVTLFYLASALALLGDMERARTVIARCVALSESLGDQWIRGWALWIHGIVAWRQGDPRRAAELERASIRRKLQFDDRMGVGQCVEVLAWAAAAEGDAIRAAHLLGAVQVIWAEAGASLYRHLAGFHQEVEAELRSRLGADVVEAAMAGGANLAFDEIIAEVMGEQHVAHDEPRATEADSLEALTPREREVAGLITQGLSNKQIAARLVISKRTAEGHVEHIMAKLGFNSRTQIAAWYARQATPGGQAPHSSSG